MYELDDYVEYRGIRYHIIGRIYTLNPFGLLYTIQGDHPSNIRQAYAVELIPWDGTATCYASGGAMGMMALVKG